MYYFSDSQWVEFIDEISVKSFGEKISKFVLTNRSESPWATRWKISKRVEQILNALEAC